MASSPRRVGQAVGTVTLFLLLVSASVSGCSSSSPLECAALCHASSQGAHSVASADLSCGCVPRLYDVSSHSSPPRRMERTRRILEGSDGQNDGKTREIVAVVVVFVVLTGSFCVYMCCKGYMQRRQDAARLRALAASESKSGVASATDAGESVARNPMFNGNNEKERRNDINDSSDRIGIPGARTRAGAPSSSGTVAVHREVPRESDPERQSFTAPEVPDNRRTTRRQRPSIATRVLFTPRQADRGHDAALGVSASARQTRTVGTRMTTLKDLERQEATDTDI